MIGIILTLAVAAFAAYAVYAYVRAFREATGTVWQRAVEAAKGSATILWNGFVGAASAITLAAEKVAVFLNMPEVATFINQTVPVTYVAWALITITGISILARLRTLVWN